MHKMIAIIGPTACGKTQTAVALARRLTADGTAAEILSADSRQVYRRMDIGTGKDLADYDGVAFHLIDICEPGTRYNLFAYMQDFKAALADVQSRGVLPIVCGGSGLYVEAVLKDYRLSPVPQNPELRSRLEGLPLSQLAAMLEDLKRQNGTHMHNTTDVDTAQRAIRAIEIEMGSRDAGHTATDDAAAAACSTLVVGLSIDRELRRQRITDRLRHRLEHGMEDEVRRLLDSGISPQDLIYYGLEYKYVTERVTGLITREEMFGRLETAIHQFAKRQMTWFRGMERRGIKIHWLDATLPADEKTERIIQLYDSETFT